MADKVGAATDVSRGWAGHVLSVLLGGVLGAMLSQAVAGFANYKIQEERLDWDRRQKISQLCAKLAWPPDKAETQHSDWDSGASKEAQAASYELAGYRDLATEAVCDQLRLETLYFRHEYASFTLKLMGSASKACQRRMIELLGDEHRWVAINCVTAIALIPKRDRDPSVCDKLCELRRMKYNGFDVGGKMTELECGNCKEQ